MHIRTNWPPFPPAVHPDPEGYDWVFSQCWDPVIDALLAAKGWSRSGSTQSSITKSLLA